MAIIQGIIQVRLGKEIELDKSKLLPGEFGFTKDTRRLFMGSSSGAVELMTKEEFDIPDENIRKEIEEYLSENPIENDWNNLRNRPFYAVPVDSETAVDIISPMNPANSYGIRKSYSFGIDSDGTWLEIGKPLHIFIDGVEYQLTVEETTIEGVVYRYVGNPHLVGDLPENIPGFNFSIYAEVTDGVVEYHRVYMNTTLPEDSHTIVINEQVLEYHKIPIEYLPDGYGGVEVEITNETLGQGYAICSTSASSTAKVTVLPNYELVNGGIVAVKFINAVPANAILNINSKGAKAIYYRGAKITAGIIEAGDTATFIYNGSFYHLLTVDKGMGANELPEVTTTDNGAFLRVVNGEWNKAYIENAEEVSF